MIQVKDEITRYSWIYFSQRTSDAADVFRIVLADVRADGLSSVVETANI